MRYIPLRRVVEILLVRKSFGLGRIEDIINLPSGGQLFSSNPVIANMDDGSEMRLATRGKTTRGCLELHARVSHCDDDFGGSGRLFGR